MSNQYAIMPYSEYVEMCDVVREITGTTSKVKPVDITTTLEDPPAEAYLPELTTPASASEVFKDKEYIDDAGDKKAGTFTIDSELNECDSLLTQIETALQSKASGGTTIEAWTGTVYAGGGLGMYQTICYYTDETLTLRSVILPNRGSATITIAANTIVVSTFMNNVVNGEILYDLNNVPFCVCPTSNNFEIS